MIRTWLKFVNRNPSQEQPASDPAESNVPNPPQGASSTTMVQVIAEETIMAVAQWLVNLVNHSIQAKPVAPVEPTPETVASPPNPNEELLSKFGRLIEQLADRDQKLLPLEQRFQQMEAALANQEMCSQQLQTSIQMVDRLSQRLIRVEDWAGRVNEHELDRLIEQNEQLTQRLNQSQDAIALFDLRLMQLESQVHPHSDLVDKVAQFDQTLSVLNHRIDRLESLLRHFSKFAKIVEGNRQAIATLQAQLPYPSCETNGRHKQIHPDQPLPSPLQPITAHAEN